MFQFLFGSLVIPINFTLFQTLSINMFFPKKSCKMDVSERAKGRWELYKIIFVFAVTTLQKALKINLLFLSVNELTLEIQCLFEWKLHMLLKQICSKKAYCPQICLKTKNKWENRLSSCKIKVFGNLQSFDLSRKYSKLF